MVVIILQYISRLNHRIVHLKLTQCYSSITSINLGKIIKNKNKFKIKDPRELSCPFCCVKTQGINSCELMALFSPNQFPKAPSLNTITRGIEFQYVNWGRGGHKHLIHSIDVGRKYGGATQLNQSRDLKWRKKSWAPVLPLLLTCEFKSWTQKVWN